MAFALVQSKLAYNSNTATFDNPVTPGNLVVVCVAEYAGHATSLTDNKGNTYNEDARKTNAITIPTASIYSTIVGTGGSSFQVTANSPGAYIGLVIAEYSGNIGSAVLHDSQGADFSGTTTPSVGPIDVDANDMLIVGCLTHNGAGGTLTPGANYTTIEEAESAASAQPISAIHDLDASADQVCDWTIYAGVVGSCVAVSYYPVGDVSAPEATNLTEPNLRTTSDGASFDIQYSENIEPASPTGFTVQVNGVTVTGTWSRPSSTVHRFTFDSTPAAGASITVAYTAGDVEDTAGNALANFSTKVVVNMQKYPGAYISHLGCTAYFNGAISSGRYQTGDHYYIGDVYIVDINPAPTGTGASARNGVVINPTLARHPSFPTTHTACPWDGRATFYDGTERLSIPFKPATGSSIILTKSTLANYDPNNAANDPENDPIPSYWFSNTISTGSSPVQNMAIINRVASAPASASFRPHPLSGSKFTYPISSVDLSFIPSLPLPAGATATDYSGLVRMLKRPAFEFERNDYASNMVGAQNWPATYGREASWIYGDAFNLMMLDSITTQQKETLAYYIIQRGIDIWGALQCDPELFWANGGFKVGRKLPVLFAKRALGTSWDTSSFEFQEDQCTSFGSGITPTGSLWTNWQNSGHQYASNVLKRVGLGTGIFYEAYPVNQWKNNPPSTPGDYCWNRQWAYSAQNCKALVGEAIAARLMNLISSWNHDAFFAMQDRWWYEPDSDLRDDMAAQAVADNWNALDPEDDWTNVNNASWASRQGTGFSTFAGYMFDEYRDYSVPEAPDGSPSSLIATPISTTRIDLAWTDNASNETGFTIQRDTVNTFDSVNLVEVNVAVPNTNSYSATSLTAATLYYFRVRAYNDDGDSSWSNTASATTLSDSGPSPGPTPPPVNTAPTSFGVTPPLIPGSSRRALLRDFFTN